MTETSTNWREETAPSHKCKICGALWRYWLQKEKPFVEGDSWSLRSAYCRECCDIAPMGEQIEPLTLGDLEKIITARLAVDAMVQITQGPKSGDSVN